MLLFWAIPPYGPVGRYKRFQETYFLHLRVCVLRTATCYLQLSYVLDLMSHYGAGVFVDDSMFEEGE